MIEDYGKIPPQAIDVEEVILGAMILEKDTSLNNPIKSEWFYKEEHQIIVKAILELNNEGISIDMIQVINRLRNCEKLEEIGAGFLLTITSPLWLPAAKLSVDVVVLPITLPHDICIYYLKYRKKKRKEELIKMFETKQE